MNRIELDLLIELALCFLIPKGVVPEWTWLLSSMVREALSIMAEETSEDA